MALRRRAESSERKPYLAVAKDVNAKLADKNDNGSKDDDEVEVHMLAETRRVYREECPPFTFSISRHASFPGDRKPVVLADDDGRRPSGSEFRKAEVVCRPYGVKTGFWTLDLDGARMIVRGRGVGRGVAYKIWWGPEEGFGEKPVAFSNRAARDEVGTQSDDETVQPDHDSLHEQSDEETDFTLVDATQPSIRKHQSRKAKNKGQVKMERLAAMDTDTDRELKAKKESLRLRTLQEQKLPAQARSVTNNIARANHSSLPNPTGGTSLPSPSTTHSPPAQVSTKRDRSPAKGPGRQPHKITRQRRRVTSVIKASQSGSSSINRHKQYQTTLHISLSKNDDGAVPFYLHSCMTIETLFASALSVWRLKGKDEDVVALTVRFDWLKEMEPMVVMKEVADSFQKMLETIAEAPVWKESDEARTRCDVRVGFVVREQ